MKGCLVLQRRFAVIGHELAILLKERHDVDTFCAYVHLRTSYDFLVAQRDIPYTNLILDEDIQKQYKNEILDLTYLAEFEREYGSVWKFIGVDRVIRYGQLVREYPHDTSPYTHEDMLRMVQVYAKQCSAFLDAEKPDFIFSYMPGALGSLLFQEIAKKRGIPIFTVVFPMTRNRISVSERFDRLTGADDLFKKALAMPLEKISHYQEARALIEEFRSKPVLYSDVYLSLVKHGKWRQFDFLLPQRLAHSLYYNTYKIFTDWKKKRATRTDYTTVHPWHHIFDRVRRKLRNVVGIDDLYDAYDASKPFVFFPLHLEPELAILLLAPFDTDQISIVKRLAQSLPVGMYVYVKEHPQMTPLRPRSFYKELKKIPNVRLLRPEISSFTIIPACSLVAIITGSAGWEASLLGKPVITFGDVFYNALSSVTRSRSPEELPTLVKQQLERGRTDDHELTRFVAALLEDSAECDLLYLWEIETDAQKVRTALTDFADIIGKKIRSVTR